MIRNFKYFRGCSGVLKGHMFLDAGYVFAPYIPVMLPPEPIQDFQPIEINFAYTTRIINNMFFQNFQLSINE